MGEPGGGGQRVVMGEERCQCAVRCPRPAALPSTFNRRCDIDPHFKLKAFNAPLSFWLVSN